MVSSGPYRKNGYYVPVSRHRNRFPEILEFHNLNMWDAGYCHDRVRMNQSIIDGRIHYLSTNKIQHISADHQDNRFRQTYNRAPVELRLRSQLQPSLPEDPAHTLLVTARHQHAFLGFVGRGVDEIQ